MDIFLVYISGVLLVLLTIKIEHRVAEERLPLTDALVFSLLSWLACAVYVAYKLLLVLDRLYGLLLDLEWEKM